MNVISWVAFPRTKGGNKTPKENPVSTANMFIDDLITKEETIVSFAIPLLTEIIRMRQPIMFTMEIVLNISFMLFL